MAAGSILYNIAGRLYTEAGRFAIRKTPGVPGALTNFYEMSLLFGYKQTQEKEAASRRAIVSTKDINW